MRVSLFVILAVIDAWPFGCGTDIVVVMALLP